jgi:CheY-like chemotaxis protein
MSRTYHVAFLGFSDFERKTLGSYFRLATHRTPHYELSLDVAGADFLVADADHAPSVRLVTVTERLDNTVFIGAAAPPGATAWMMRPIDPLHVLRELDTMVAASWAAAPPAQPPGRAEAKLAGLGPTTVIRPRRPTTLASLPALDLPTLLEPAPGAPEAGAAPSAVWPPLPQHIDVDELLPTLDISLDEVAAQGLPSVPPPLPRTDTVPGVFVPLPEAAAPDAAADAARAVPAAPDTPPAPAEAAPDQTARAAPSPSPAPELAPELAPEPPPAVAPPPATAVPAPRRRRRGRGIEIPSGPPPRALLVDDSELALRFLELKLRRFGVQTERASNSRRAIELLARGAYDLVFVDLELGDDSELDGLALCQHIRRHQSAAAALTSQLVIVSAHHAETDRVRGTLAGADGYLGKPLNDAELERLLVRQGLQPLAQDAASGQANA